MVSSNANALGVIFANSYDNLVPELVAERTMASIPFAGRYRMIDFVLSNMANAGVDNVSVIVRKNYHSLMDHLGAGREWDLTRKRGGLNIVPPFAERSIKLYSGRVDALASVLNWLRDQKERYVILSDSNIAMNFDFNKLIEAHVKSGADVTMVYNRGEIPDGARTDNYTIRIDNGRVAELLSNDYRPGVQNLSMNLYIIERESLIQLVRDASVRGLVYFERDILARNLSLLNVQAYEFDGYVARISDMKSYLTRTCACCRLAMSISSLTKATPSTPRFVTTTPPVTWKAARSRTACWLTAVWWKAPLKTVCCSVAARSRRVLLCATVC